jgi:microcystin-dependent protein
MAAISRRQYKGAAASTTITSGINDTDATPTVNIAATTGWPSTPGVSFFVVIDPGTSFEEKCLATISGTTLTLDRASTSRDDTSKSTHTSGAVIYPVFTATEANEANLMASTMTTRGDLLTMGSGPTVARLGLGATSYALTSNGTDAVWAQITADGIATSAVTSDKILNETIVNLDISPGAAIAHTKLANATAGQVLLGTTTTGVVTATTVSGDVTITGAGVTAITPGAVVQADMASALLQLLCPVGTISAYAGDTAPTGWLLCTGVSTSGYTTLASLVGATTPDLKGRFALGKTTTGVGSSLLGTGGSTTITTGNLPSHSHANTAASSATSHSHGISPQGSTYHSEDAGTVDWNLGDTGNLVAIKRATTFPTSTNAETAHTHTITMTNASTGSGDAYNQPFLAVNYIIKHDYV